MKKNIPSEHNYIIKLLVLGDVAVGKSSLISRWADDKFSESHLFTIGMDFRTKTIKIHRKNIKAQIWDTAGQERFRVVSKTLYQGAMGIMLAFDCTSEKSFHNVRDWMLQINTHASADICKILISTKCDLEGKVVSAKRGKDLADEFRMDFFETSAKNNINVNEAFLSLIGDVVDKNIPDRDSIRLSKEESETEKKCC